MVDDFPSNAADADREMQMRIDAELRNSERVQADFERAYPEDPGAKVRTLVIRSQHQPRSQVLYPDLAAAQDRQVWLMPLVRRLMWHEARGVDGAPWAGRLKAMIHLALAGVRAVSEAEFVALAGAAKALSKPSFQRYAGHMAGFARRLEPLGKPAVEALRGMLGQAGERGDFDDRKRLAWPLFRAEGAFEESDRSWGARVRRDVAGMPPKMRAEWLKVFDADVDKSCGSAGAPTKSCLAAIKRLGNAQLEAGLRRWIGMLVEDGGALAPLDVVVCLHLMVLCNLLGGAACDQLLYQMARAPWTQKPEHFWFYTYLWVLDRRSQDHAFACLEALMMNPLTAVYEVRRKYEALLAVFGAGAMAESPVGVDGFPLDSDPALGAQQTRIDQMLRMAASAAAQGPYTDPSVAVHLEALRVIRESGKSDALNPAMKAAAQMWEAQMTRPLPWFPVAPEVREAHAAMEAATLKEFAADPNALYRAVMSRVEWIKAHQEEYSKDTLRLWEEWLTGLGGCGGLLQRGLSQVEEPPLATLLGALRHKGGSEKVLGLCENYVARHGWTPELVEAFRKWIPTLGVAAGAIIPRARAEWLVWFEDLAPIDAEACWSHRVKQDLRRMPKQEAAGWRALLENHTFIITGKPPAKWMKAAETVFPALGAAAFRRRFVEWFAPFGKGEELRLTVTGRHILRTLMWYTLIAKDAAVDAALLGFANVRWKNKETAQRAAQAEMAFSYVLGQRMPEAALPILEKLVAGGQAFRGSTTHRVYEQLCARWNRKPIAAIPAKAKAAKEPKLNPILDNMTIGEFRSMMQKLR